MNRPYLHSILASSYKQLREIEEKLSELNRERVDTLASIKKNEMAFDELGDFDPDSVGPQAAANLAAGLARNQSAPPEQVSES